MGDGKGDSNLLREYLADRDVPCPQCAYNLRALTGDTCPECGDRIILRVGLVEPRQAALIAGLIALACGAGFNAMLLIVVLIEIPSWDAPRVFGVVAIGLVAFGTMLALWLVRWRWIRARPVRQRWGLVVACWIAVLADLAAFITFVQ
jgi:DNA-directed RNA polymerase subunit RPC12/RpoP